MTGAFSESVGLLLKLHRLFLHGQHEGSEADALRDAMEPHWYVMTEDEQRLVRKLSAHLYCVGDRSTAAPPASEIEQAFAQARRDQRWEEVLDLLRDHPGLAAPRDRSLLRGQAWTGLGVREAADEFFRDAANAVPAGPSSPSPTAQAPPGKLQRPPKPFPRLRPAA